MHSLEIVEDGTLNDDIHHLFMSSMLFQDVVTDNALSAMKYAENEASHG